MDSIRNPQEDIYNSSESSSLDISMPQTTQFVNGLLHQLSKLADQSSASRETERSNNNNDDNESRHHHRHPQSHPTSAFPAARLAQLKPLMLTLHCLFPNEFLLALDILDRGLVRRVRTKNGTEPGNQDSPEEAPQPTDVDLDTESQIQSQRTGKEDFFFVTSASTIPNPASRLPSQFQPGTQHHQWQEKGYEVRLHAWNCTCPSFTISAFRGLGPEPSSPSSSSSSGVRSEKVDEGTPGDEYGHAADVDLAAADAQSTPAYSFGGTLTQQPESAPPVCKHILACLLAAVCPSLGGGAQGVGGEGRFVELAREEVAGLCAGWGG
ncbi:hypothetical protein BJX61DRAFT_363004 [Aspergillus egyptiacus]|nr:hypothetical protein BJX61DRAFT_363004 [Aspergillus egyptiacus]